MAVDVRARGGDDTGKNACLALGVFGTLFCMKIEELGDLGARKQKSPGVRNIFFDFSEIVFVAGFILHGLTIKGEGGSLGIWAYGVITSSGMRDSSG